MSGLQNEAKILFDLLLPDDFLTNQTLCIVPDCAWDSDSYWLGKH